MTYENIISLVSTSGLAVALVIWGTFKVDKFLSNLCTKLDDYNIEFNTINLSIEALTSKISQLIEVMK